MEALFWVLFIFVKNQHHIFEDPLESGQLLNVLLLLAFTEVFTQISPEVVNKAFKEHFPELAPCPPQRYGELSTMMVNKLQEVHEFRYEHQQLNLQALVKDDNFRTRYLDDIGNQYDRFAIGLPDNTVN